MEFIKGSGKARTTFDRHSLSPHSLELSTSQREIDGMVSNFLTQATETKSLLAMMAGGLVYRGLRVGALSLGSQYFSKVPLLVRHGSSLISLAGESATFAGVNRGLEGQLFHPGFGKEWAGSAINLGALRFFGKWAEAQNPILQHLFADVGLVTSHHLAALAKIEEKPEGDLLTQLVKADVMNWQMKASTALLHSLAPHLHATERSMDLWMKNQERNLVESSSTLFNFQRTQPAAAFSGARVKESPIQEDSFATPPSLMAGRKNRNKSPSSESSQKERTQPEEAALQRAHEIEKKLWDRNWEILEEAFSEFRKIFPHLEPKDRLPLASEIEEHLEFDYEFRFSSLLSELFPYLEPKDRLTLASKIEKRCAVLERARVPGLRVLSKIVPLLKPRDRLSFAFRIAKHLQNDEEPFPFVSEEATMALGEISPHLKPKDRLTFALKIEERLWDGIDEQTAREVFRASDYPIENVVMSRLWSDLEALRKIFPHLEPRDQFFFASKIEEKLQNKEKGACLVAVNFLNEIWNLILSEGNKLKLEYLKRKEMKELGLKMVDYLSSEMERANTKGSSLETFITGLIKLTDSKMPEEVRSEAKNRLNSSISKESHFLRILANSTREAFDPKQALSQIEMAWNDKEDLKMAELVYILGFKIRSLPREEGEGIINQLLFSPCPLIRENYITFLLLEMGFNPHDFWKSQKTLIESDLKSPDDRIAWEAMLELSDFAEREILEAFEWLYKISQDSSNPEKQRDAQLILESMKNPPF